MGITTLTVPMHIFDQDEFVGKSWFYREGINWETLGLFLYPDKYLQPVEPEIPNNVWEFLTLAFRNLYQSHEISYYQTSIVDQHRTIEISDCGISSTDFEIEIGSEKYQQLYVSGKKAARSFFGMEG